jgi:hypothetical protein
MRKDPVSLIGHAAIHPPLPPGVDVPVVRPAWPPLVAGRPDAGGWSCELQPS